MQQQCSECGRVHEACPDCGSPKVLMLEPERGPAGKSVAEFVKQADDGDSRQFTNTCWECGWSETKTVTVTVE